MQYTEEDRRALYDAWMSYKVKKRVTQIEMAKKLGISQLIFSGVIHGQMPLEHNFVNQLCNHMDIDPVATLPSLRAASAPSLPGAVMLTNTFILDGDIKNVHYKGNQLIVEYERSV